MSKEETMVRRPSFPWERKTREEIVAEALAELHRRLAAIMAKAKEGTGE